MIEFVKNIDNFWKQDLEEHTYARKVDFVAKNFSHLDKKYYNREYFLQSFNNELSNAGKFKETFNLEKASVSWTCILPNRILPTHRDTFYTLRQEHNAEVKQCFRYLVFLEDFIFGQYVGFEKQSITDWKAGDVWKFDSTELHYAVNASNTFFHTCQVSSITDE